MQCHYSLDMKFLITLFFMFLDLLDLADSYCEQRLKKICEDLIKRSVSIENVSNLLAAAVKYNATVSNRERLVIPWIFLLFK